MYASDKDTKTQRHKDTKTQSRRVVGSRSQEVKKEDVSMSYKSKRTLSSIGAGVILMIVYLVYALGENAPAQTDVAAWAKLILVFIGMLVALALGTAIVPVLHIFLGICLLGTIIEGIVSVFFYERGIRNG